MVVRKLQIYKCEICGNLIQVILPGIGTLSCCEQPMVLQIPQKDNSEFGEKHNPIISKEGLKFNISVLNHPMNKDHYVEFIEGYKDDKSELYLKYLSPQDCPTFSFDADTDKLQSLEYCNLHGLWGNSYD